MIMCTMLVPRSRSICRGLGRCIASPDWLHGIKTMLGKIDVIVVQIHKDCHVETGVRVVMEQRGEAEYTRNRNNYKIRPLIKE